MWGVIFFKALDVVLGHTVHLDLEPRALQCIFFVVQSGLTMRETFQFGRLNLRSGSGSQLNRFEIFLKTTRTSLPSGLLRVPNICGIHFCDRYPALEDTELCSFWALLRKWIPPSTFRFTPRDIAASFPPPPSDRGFGVGVPTPPLPEWLVWPSLPDTSTICTMEASRYEFKEFPPISLFFLRREFPPPITRPFTLPGLAVLPLPFCHEVVPRSLAWSRRPDPLFQRVHIVQVSE